MEKLISTVNNALETLKKHLFEEFMKKILFGTMLILVDRVIFLFLMMIKRELLDSIIVI